MFSKLSNWITDRIYISVPDADPEKREIIEYGAYMTLSEVSKVTLLLIFGAILRIFPYVAAAIMIFGFLRMTLGGIHAKTHWGCIVSYFCFIYGSVALSFVVRPDRLIIDLIIIPFVFLVTYRYAPADMPVKPVASKKQRKRLRIMGFALLAILFTAAQFADPVWFNVTMFTILIQNSLMTPLIYKITNNKYGKEAPA